MSARMEETPRYADPLANTHEVFNQPPPLQDYNLFTQDNALMEAVRANGAGWAEEALTTFGALTGRAETIELGSGQRESAGAGHPRPIRPPGGPGSLPSRVSRADAHRP